MTHFLCVVLSLALIAILTSAFEALLICYQSLLLPVTSSLPMAGVLACIDLHPTPPHPPVSLPPLDLLEESCLRTAVHSLSCRFVRVSSFTEARTRVLQASRPSETCCDALKHKILISCHSGRYRLIDLGAAARG